jgi:hypothetical protein
MRAWSDLRSYILTGVQQQCGHWWASAAAGEPERMLPAPHARRQLRWKKKLTEVSREIGIGCSRRKSPLGIPRQAWWQV